MTMLEFRAWDKKRNEIVDVMNIDFSNKKINVYENLDLLEGI